jgi:hypothetical protein
VLPKRKRAKPGDVLELKTANRCAYLQYIGRHLEYGDAVLVSPKLYSSPTAVTGELFSNAYVTFYPLTAAVAEGLVEVVGHLAPPKLPQRLRRPGAISGRQVETWVIEDDAGEEVVRRKLSEEELRLPIASIWNHEFLIQRITEGWNPSEEGRE